MLLLVSLTTKPSRFPLLKCPEVVPKSFVPGTAPLPVHNQIREEFRMGLRPTHRYENQIESERVRSSRVERQRSRQLWMKRGRGRVSSGTCVLNQSVSRHPSRREGW